MPGRSFQLPLPTLPTWGGRRKGAGRKPTPGRRPGVPHRPRPPHVAAHPVHVTMRGRHRAPLSPFRAGVPAVRRALGTASHPDFRILQFSVQQDHIHLIVEADHQRALFGGVRGLAIRLARTINRVLGRRGQVRDSRYHARTLTTPRAVRHALVYVLANFRKHLKTAEGIDPCSSAAWFNGWRVPCAPGIGPPPVRDARTWLARIGWRRHGRIHFAEHPRM